MVNKVSGKLKDDVSFNTPNSKFQKLANDGPVGLDTFDEKQLRTHKERNGILADSVSDEYQKLIKSREDKADALIVDFKAAKFGVKNPKRLNNLDCNDHVIYDKAAYHGEQVAARVNAYVSEAPKLSKARVYLSAKQSREDWKAGIPVPDPRLHTIIETLSHPKIPSTTEKFGRTLPAAHPHRPLVPHHAGRSKSQVVAEANDVHKLAKSRKH
jgi:hypothetical protein